MPIQVTEPAYRRHLECSRSRQKGTNNTSRASSVLLLAAPRVGNELSSLSKPPAVLHTGLGGAGSLGKRCVYAR